MAAAVKPEGAVPLRIVPVNRDTAFAFCRMWHRTHQAPPPGHVLLAGVADDLDVLRGVAIVGRPVSVVLKDGVTVEINRTATDGAANANSKLYGAAAQAAKAVGYGRIITYTQKGESGASLKAAGFVAVEELEPRGGWSHPSRPREDHGGAQVARIRWERILSPGARPWAQVARPADPDRSALMPAGLWEAS